MEQYSIDNVGKGQMVSSCETPQLAGGSSTKDLSHHQQLTERESPDSPSPVKRWEIGPFLQSFKSKMASFTEIVMSPVRLFKQAEPLSSIVLPDQHEKLAIESNMESSIQTEEGDVTNGECKIELLSKRPSTEKVQCNTLPKRHRVAQRLNFDTFSSSNQEPVLEHNEVYDNAQVTPKDNQIHRPSLHPQVILQDKNCHTRPCTPQSPYLRSGLKPSSDKPLNSTNAMQWSFQDATVVIQRLSSTPSSEVGCKYGSESNAVLADRTEKTFSNNPEISSATDYHLKDEDTKRYYIEESYSQATRKSPRKLFKPVSETGGSTSTKLATFGRGPVDGMKKSQSVSVNVQTYHSVEVSDPTKSTLVGNVRSKRSRGALRTETKKDTRASPKCDLWKAEEGGLRRAKNKKVKESSITLEENQEDIICVQVRKKRKGFSTSQKLQDSNIRLDTSNTTDVDIRQSVTSESCESTEIQGKRKHFQTRKNQKCRMLQASSNKSECADSTEDATRHVLTDSNTNIMNDCNCEISRLSQSPDLKDSVQTNEAEKTKIRKTRQHVFKNADDPSLQKKILRPTRRTFKDYSAISVADPAGPSGPSRKTALQNKSIISADSRVSLQSDRERKRSRTTKILNRQKRKQAEKNEGGKDKAEIPQNVEAIPVLSLSGSGSNRLLRSYSCPEIPSLLFSDCHVPLSHTHDRGSTSPTKKTLPIHLHSPSKRLRRHTVCSVEIEREIAPLCLRKEVYPASRGGPSHSLCPSAPLSPAASYSPSNSLTAHASCFLSSPLAFLSKNSSLGRGHDSDIANGSAGLDATSFSSTSSTPSLCRSSFASTPTFSSPLTSTVVTPSPEIPSASVSSLCSAFSSSSDEEHGTLQMECQEAMDEEKAFGLKLSSSISEDKAFSDSEIKTDSKDGQRGKVSSIRICKKLPKPQNNLTPMGLPKAIRIKKKDFSLEEIYTNKNFSKPPDGRLETIFEVPLNRRDGSQAVVGPKKVKRFVEFPELGVARKPKKPLVVGLAGGGAQRKAGGNSAISRTRRGVGASSKADDVLTLQQLDSLLCSKLEELDTWMALQQVAC
nr:uncharacterized protein prr14 [Misgurnus anguillicaudatus]XP_055049787.1 uncharacterized protein prr14 [Misgurnus anguillicaudatus]XP_055049788.1 uncharacterized protein prr14 [Misgurnus anguillicaudatus]XP_055049789.1 uncharacterized protein prr14 [Misgurnus anguillicaudatus]XP_055049790.1 uncharacterized protein prr14 [Misgurnus anguillicaudatus]XP_055049791.1 uncharacterized protein prr14 [Misgurnus anguillicaudatus]